MNVEPFETVDSMGSDIELFGTESIWSNNDVYFLVNPNSSNISICFKTIKDPIIVRLTYSEYCELLNKLMYTNKRLRKHHHAGKGLVGDINKIKKQIEELQKQLKELES